MTKPCTFTCPPASCFAQQFEGRVVRIFPGQSAVAGRFFAALSKAAPRPSNNPETRLQAEVSR